MPSPRKGSRMNGPPIAAPAIRSPWFHGWTILAVAFLAQMLSMGTTVYGFGVFVKPLTTEFNVSRATLNNGFILFMLGMGLFSILIGRLLDRYPIRLIMFGGAIIMGAGFAALSACRTLTGMGLIIVGPLAFGATAIGPLVASTLVANWFTRLRGRAMGISSVATSLGGALVVPLIALSLEQFGWRVTLAVVGVLVAVLAGLSALLFIHNRPADIGLITDGSIQTSAQPGAFAGDDQSPRDWLYSRNFWCITFSVGLCFAINQSFLISLVPYATDLQIGLKQATLLLSCSSIASIAGKLVIGACADHIDKRLLMLLVIVCIVVQMSVLILQPSFLVLLIVCTLAGFAIGGELPVWGALVADCFGSVKYGAVMGAMNAVNTLLGLGAVYFIGTIYDRTASYAMAFQIFIGIAVLAALFLLFIRAKTE